MNATRRALFDAAVLFACALALLSWPLRYLRRNVFSRNKRNSIWAGTPIINMATNARAERLLGINARSLVYSTYFTTSEFDYDFSRLTRIPLFRGLVPLLVFIWGCVVADRFHFYCDRGLLPPRKGFTFDFRELKVYRILGIPVFLWTYGADVRSRAISQAMGRPNTCSFCDAPGRHCVCDPDTAAYNVRTLAELSTAVFSGMGDMYGYTPGSIDDVFFWPVDLASDNYRKYQPVFPDASADRPLRIVHSTNHRMFKGTDFLIGAVDELKSEGAPLELVLVERVPNRKALDLYRSADIVFDNCVMGNIGFLGIEAMALGKPVMCFIRHPETQLLAANECPVINTHLTTLKEDIRHWAGNRSELAELGRRGRAYVEKHYSLPAFASRLQAAYEALGENSCPS